MRQSVKTAIEFCDPDMEGPIKKLILDTINDEFGHDQIRAIGTLLHDPFLYSECGPTFGDISSLLEYKLVALARFEGNNNEVKTWVVVTPRGHNVYQSISKYLPSDRSQ